MIADAATERTYRALDELRIRLPAMRDALVPGRGRRGPQRLMTAEQRARADQEARADRAAKHHAIVNGLGVLGASPAPLRVDVLDAIGIVETGVAEMESAVCEWLGLTPLPAGTTARITRIIKLLNRVAAHRELAGWLCAAARRLNRIAGRAIGDAEQIHHLKARCPHCDTLALCAFVDRETVMCVNADCRCTDPACPCQGDRPARHQWPLTAWPELAETLPAIGG